jgi:hypothetical protein
VLNSSCQNTASRNKVGTKIHRQKLQRNQENTA